MSALVEIKDVCKVYNPGENEVRALDHVSLTIDEQEFVAIIGHSGSGKSTLMNMLGCLDVPTSGEYPQPGDRLYFPGIQSDPQSDCGGKCRTATDLPGSIQKCTAGAFQRSTEKGGTGTPYGS